jgi:hypothetical protein
MWGGCPAELPAFNLRDDQPLTPPTVQIVGPLPSMRGAAPRCRRDAGALLTDCTLMELSHGVATYIGGFKSAV